MASQRFNIPNALTMMRIALVPVFAWLWLRGSALAVGVMFVAGITDLFDGWLARKLDQQTPLGARLDPVADKLLVFVSLTIALYRDAAPLWFVESIVGRDAVMALGAILVWRLEPDYYKNTLWKPTFIGKTASALVALMCGILAIEDLMLPGDTLGVALVVAMAICSALVLITLVQYAVIAIRGLRAHRAQRR